MWAEQADVFKLSDGVKDGPVKEAHRGRHDRAAFQDTF